MPSRNVPPVPGLPAGAPPDPTASANAQSLGPANQNETTPPEQRRPQGTPLSDGPTLGKSGEHLPATYKLVSGNLRTDR